VINYSCYAKQCTTVTIEVTNSTTNGRCWQFAR